MVSLIMKKKINFFLMIKNIASKAIIPFTNHNLYKNLLSNQSNKLIFACGPAGTGKTMLATQQAIADLKSKKVDRIIITRPTIGADEDIGFLPGTLEDKMAPWVKPIFDVFLENYKKVQLEKMVKNEVIEIAPLAFMRGRTFKKSFIIGDELQNTTVNQMKMLLTRIGDGSRMVATGDIEQADLEGISGLEHFVELLERCPEMEEIKYVVMGQQDIRRSEIVKKVLRLYEVGEGNEEYYLIKQKIL